MDDFKTVRGRIIRLMSYGYGFIMGKDGTSAFFHSSNLKNHCFESLRVGCEVEYIPVNTPKGKNAIEVEVI